MENIIQPTDIKNLLKKKYDHRAEKDEFGNTGHYVLSPKEILDIYIDLEKLEGAKLLVQQSASSGYGGENKHSVSTD